MCSKNTESRSTDALCQGANTCDLGLRVANSVFIKASTLRAVEGEHVTTAPTGDDPSWTYLVVFFVAVLVVCCIIAVVFSAFAVRCLVRASWAKRRRSVADNGKLTAVASPASGHVGTCPPGV